MTTKELAKRIRIHAVNMTHSGKSSHIGSILSIADILAVLYNDIMNIFPEEPKNPLRDRFILSKGHAGAGVYAVLAEKGFFPIDTLSTHYQNGSLLSGHVSHKGIPGVEFSTGSLGHGLPVGAGMAYTAKQDNKKHRVFVLMSDGECDEGSNWEAILFSAHHSLTNLIVIVDYNKIQSMDSVENTIRLEPFEEKWEKFGWETFTVDGHNVNELKEILVTTINNEHKTKPTCIIANTVKGKGVSFMEDKVLWHYRTPQGEEYINAIKELKDNNA